MRISARCDYACRALLEIGRHWPNKSLVQIHTISKKQNIPIKYLVQILIQLKRIGLIESVRGREGGYKLARPPHKIILAEVVRETGGPILPRANSGPAVEPVFGAIWQEIEETITKALDKITFEDILNRAKGREGILSYQI